MKDSQFDKKISLNSSASDILDKVNRAISEKADSFPESEDVLELIDSIQENNNQSSGMLETINNIAAPEAPKQEETMKQNVEEKEKLVSTTTAQTTAALFNQLKESAKTKQTSESVKFRAGTTVEDLIKELVKPHLSAWLDQNLPSIVKAAVEKEVKKLIPTED